MGKFPMPFSGITQATSINPTWLTNVMYHILNGCGEGHAHNFAIEMDNLWPTIHGSPLLMSCITNYVDSKPLTPIFIDPAR